MPNVKNINTVIAAIQAEQIAYFQMMDWLRECPRETNACGTAACIGGFTDLVMKPGLKKSEGGGIMNVCNFLGINKETGDALFFAENSIVELYEITKSMAIAALTDLRDGMGFKDWYDYT